MKRLTVSIIFLMIISSIFLIGFYKIIEMQKASIPKDEIRFVALGDSYTIGDGVTEDERYPNLLVKHLKNEGFNITLVANPSISGRTSSDVLQRQIPILKDSNANFVTLLIGANDIAQSVNSSNFQKNFTSLLDEIQNILPHKNWVIVLTIPDFSVTPAGSQFIGGGILLGTVIHQFNQVIKKECEARDIKVVDITPLTQQMTSDQSLIADDGLHPSAKEYEKWEELLYPTAYNLLTSK